MLKEFQQLAGSPSDVIYKPVLINSDRIERVEGVKLATTEEAHCDVYLVDNGDGRGGERMTVLGSYEDVKEKLGGE